MARWNQHHDTVGVLPSDLWAHPRFTVLARHDGDDLTGGAILHDAGTVVGLSNTWSSEDVPVDPRVLLDIAAETHPGRAVVDYAWGRGPRDHAGRRVRAAGSAARLDSVALLPSPTPRGRWWWPEPGGGFLT